MISGFLMAMAYSGLVGMSALSGQILDEAGQPIPEARVFAEAGLTGAVVETRTSDNGYFRFEDLSPGEAGIFAVAPGYGFGGIHLEVRMADELPAQAITLRVADRVAGKVKAHRGSVLADAHVTGVVILGAQKVGIPLAKLEAFGFEAVRSDATGAFAIGNLPRGGKVAIKVAHPEYAQEGLTDIAVGKEDIVVEMQRGVLVRGETVTQDREAAVAKAQVIFRSAQPPHDSVLATTDGMGAFALRLKPGVYGYQATGAAYRSGGWQEFTVSGESPQLRLSLIVAGTGMVRGAVKNALTGQPVEGARLTLERNGNRLTPTRTGPTGEFRLTGAAGNNEVILEPPPGFMPPATAPSPVIVAEGREIELPGLWLTPIPAYRLQVLQADGETPAPAVVVSLLRPQQFGWRITDENGWVEIRIGQMPPDRTIVGMAEHRTEPLGALFVLGPEDAGGARVQLLSLASVRGRVVDDKAKGLPGVTVGAVFPGEATGDALLLWRCLSGKDGVFTWNAVSPGVPQQCVAQAKGGATGVSMVLNAQPGADNDIGDLVIKGGVKSASLLGKRLRWYEGRLLCGTLPDRSAVREHPVLLTYCDSDVASQALEGLSVVQELTRNTGLIVALLVEGDFSTETAPLPVLSGKAPSAASTYLLDRNGVVVLETFGTPPLRALQAWGS